MNRNFLEKLSTRQQQELDGKLRDSLDLLIIGVALDRTLNDHSSSMRRLLNRGGKIRVILENPIPDSSAVKMTIRRRQKSITIDGWLGRVRDNISTLDRLKKETGGNLQVRLTDYHLSRGEILVDANSSEGIFFIWLYSFQVEAENQPKFILYPQDKWYQHFREEAERIWNDAVDWSNS
ncbi:MAG: hypothetical protein AAFX78_15800 [Cyanobacteria bacterium J06638_20]